MNNFKTKITLIVVILIFFVFIYQCVKPLSRNEKMILTQFDDLPNQKITSIEVRKVSVGYLVVIKNKEVIEKVLNKLRTKEKVRGSGPRMKDRYYITINTTEGSFSFYFRKIVKDMLPECKYGHTFPQVINCAICTDLFVSNKSQDASDTFETVDFNYFNSKFPVYRCESLAYVINEYVDIYENQKPEKGQVFVIE